MSSASGSRAASVVSSWCKASKIPVDVSNERGCELTITDKVGQKVHVALANGTVPAFNPALRTVVVDSDNVLSVNLNDALTEFHKLTEAVGYGKPVPVSRGEAPKGRRLNQTDDFELIAVRHNEFRAAPNLAEAEYKPYSDVILSACKSFQRMNWNVCKEMQLDVPDLTSFALAWTTNFLHKYRLVKGTLDENRKLLRVHLRQRFGEFAKNLREKKNDCIPDQDTYNIATTGNVDGETEESPLDAAYIERNKKLDTRSAQKRRESAKKMLDAELTAMPHDRLVEVLTYVSEKYPDVTTREEASWRLDEHRKTCSVCANVNKKAGAV